MTLDVFTATACKLLIFSQRYLVFRYGSTPIHCQPKYLLTNPLTNTADNYKTSYVRNDDCTWHAQTGQFFFWRCASSFSAISSRPLANTKTSVAELRFGPCINFSGPRINVRFIVSTCLRRQMTNNKLQKLNDTIKFTYYRHYNKCVFFFFSALSVFSKSDVL